MEITRRYFCYSKAHATQPEELKLIGLVKVIAELEGKEEKQRNLYQCPQCKTVQLIEEVVPAKAK